MVASSRECPKGSRKNTSDDSLAKLPEGSDSQELIARPHLHIDVLLLSSELDGQPGRGFEVLRKLGEHHPDVRAGMLLGFSKSESVLEAFRAGARRVLSRQESVETQGKCVKVCVTGKSGRTVSRWYCCFRPWFLHAVFYGAFSR
jgi:DNA-binding NarL/FixJ family response regulator